MKRQRRAFDMPYPLPLLLFLAFLLLAACAGPAGRATSTPLPPGEPVAQPAPVFSSSETPTPAAAASDGPATPAVDAVQAMLATQIARKIQANVAEATAPSPTPAPPMTEEASPGEAWRALADPALSRPTSLGIAGGSGAGLYSAPGGGLIRSLPAGTTLTLTGRSADGIWYAAYLEDGQAGWVGAGTVQIFGDPDLLEVVSESFSPAIVATMLAEASQPLGPIATHAPVTATREAAPAATPIPNTGGPVTAADPSAAVAVVTVAGINVRAGPGTDYPVVGGLAQGDQMTVLARNEAADWIRIETPQGNGWVYAPLVEVTGPLGDLPVSVETSAAPLPPPDAAAAAQPQAVPGLSGHLVFQDRNGGTIYRYHLETGTLQPLTTGTDPAISPDGSTVAFVRGGGENGLYLIGLDGSNERRIYVANAPRTPSWSPDGRYIVFSQITGESQCFAIGPFCLPEEPANLPPGAPSGRWTSRDQRNLARVDPNGNDYRDLPSLNSAIAPNWHPWGIVYQSDVGLQITQDQPDAQTRPLLNEYRYRDPDWQPGDGRIIFQSQEGTHWEIFVVNADGGGIAALTRPPLGEQPNNVAPTWSPDGQWIAFVSDRGGSWGIWVMDSSGGNLRQLPVDVSIDYAFQVDQTVDWGP